MLRVYLSLLAKQEFHYSIFMTSEVGCLPKWEQYNSFLRLIEAKLKNNKKLKHSFGQPPFWQTPCYAFALLLLGLAIGFIYMGSGSNNTDCFKNPSASICAFLSSCNISYFGLTSSNGSLSKKRRTEADKY